MNDNSNSVKPNAQGSHGNQQQQMSGQQFFQQQFAPQQVAFVINGMFNQAQGGNVQQQANQPNSQQIPRFSNIDPYYEASQRTLQVIVTSRQCD